ncbi:MAG: alpha/beta hydrolase, partial [Bacteroidales bacterium]|nr:alpha/beta hydrolase [Bacteroidales bacterium]
GISDASKEPEKTYSVDGFVEVLLEFIDQLNLHDALFIGHSMGGHLLLSASTKLNSASGFVIFGTPPLGSPPDMGKYFLPNPNMLLAYKSDLDREEINSLGSAYVQEDKTVPETIINDIARAHGAMRGYIGASMIPENLPNEVAIIESFKKPIAIFHGVDDQLVNGDYLKELNIPKLWQNEIQFIPNSGHSPQLENPEHFNRKLIDFTSQILN